MNRDFEIKTIPANQIKTDVYQRRIDTRRVEKIVNNFDPRQVREACVSERENGDFYAIDGQHTITALKTVYGENVPVQCKVFTGLTFEEEAALFTKLNTNSKKTAYVDNLKADYYAGKKYAVEYIQALESNGIPYLLYNASTKRKVCSYSLTCHNSVIWAIKSYGLSETMQALSLLKLSTDYCEARGERVFLPAIICGMTVFLKTWPDADRDVLVKIALDYGWNLVRVKAATLKGSPVEKANTINAICTAKAIGAYYNKSAKPKIKLNALKVEL